MALLSKTNRVFTGFEFTQLIRHLLHSDNLNQADFLEALGSKIRFKANVDFSYPNHEVASVHKTTEGVEVYLNKFVVAGVLGELPTPYLEMCYDRLRDSDRSMADFFDIFNHRINAIRYFLLRKSHPDLFSTIEQSIPAKILLALSGQPIKVGDIRSLLGLIPLLNLRYRSRRVVTTLLRRILKLDLRVSEFEGGWVPLDIDQQTELGKKNVRLGIDLVIGERVWDQHRYVKLVVSADNLNMLSELSPGGSRHQALCDVAKWVLQYRYDIKIELHTSATKDEFDDFQSSRLRLGSKSFRLGQSAWIDNSADDGHYMTAFQINGLEEENGFV